jgi:hypothetical protein
VPRLGEVSLAHKDLPRNVPQGLGRPLEDPTATIAHPHVSASGLPPRSTPAACGGFNDNSRERMCTLPMMQQWIAKIAGALLDRMDINRIDIHLEVPALPYREL